MKEFRRLLLSGVPRVVKGEKQTAEQRDAVAFEVVNEFVDYLLSSANLTEVQKQVVKSKIYSDGE